MVLLVFLHPLDSAASDVAWEPIFSALDISHAHPPKQASGLPYNEYRNMFLQG